MKRICSVCGIEKDITNFKENKRRLKSGKISITHSRQCKKCRYKIRNKQKTREYNRLWKTNWRKDEENRKKSNQINRKSYRKHREKRLKQKANYYKNNKEKILNYQKFYRQTDKGKAKLYNAKHVYDAQKIEAFVEKVDRNLVFKRDKGICYLCNKPVNKDSWTLEHIIPISRGGKHCYKNVAVAHHTCNVSKKNKTLVEYRRMLKRNENIK